MELNTKNICIVAILVSAILFILMLLYVWNFTVDDAFISFVYGKHLASGFGLVWNIGQPPVEGYTNFLWVLIIAFLFFLKLDPIISTKVIGLLSVFGIIVLFWFITNDIFRNKKNKYIAFTVSTIFLLINPYTAIHAVSGLETMFYTFLLLGVVYSAWKIIMFHNSKFIWLFAFTALLLSLTRPEGILISLGLIFSIIYISYKKNNNSINLTSFIPILILYLVPIMIYMIFRVSYFHELLPLPFLVKTVYGNSFYTISYLILFLEYIAPFIIIILISFFKTYQRTESREMRKKTDLEYFLFTLFVAFILANIVYFFTELVMNYSQRFFYPSFILVYVSFGIAISILFNEIRNKLNVKLLKNTIPIMVCSFIVVLLLISNASFLTDLKIYHDYGNDLNATHITLGKALNSYSMDNYTFASGDAGAITYFSKWHQLDIGRLNDKFIAENGGATLEYVEKTNPELVILYSPSLPTNSSDLSHEQPFYNFVLENNYIQLDPIKFNENYYLIPFLKPNIKDFESIKDSIETVSKESNEN